MTPAGSCPDELAIRTHLERVLASVKFNRAERQSRLLKYLVETSLAGEAGALRESVIALEVFDRSADADLREDPIVRVEASRLRARLLEYYSTVGESEPIRIVIPKGAYIPEFSFAVTTLPGIEPSAIPRNEPATSEKGAASLKPQRNWLPYAAMVALLTIGASGYWWYRFSPYGPVAKRKSQAAELADKIDNLIRLHTASSLQQARVMAEHAAELDPDSATIQAKLATTYISMSAISAQLRNEVAPLALRAAENSQRLAPELPNGYQVLIRYYADVAFDWEKATSACLAGYAKLTKRENLLAICTLVHSLRGDADLARLWGEQLLQLSPNGYSKYILGLARYRSHDFQGAAQLLDETEKASKRGNPSTSWYLCLAYSGLGEHQKALDHLLAKVPPGSSSRPGHDGVLGYLAAKAGKLEMAQKAKNEVARQVQRNETSPVYLSMVDIGLGQLDSALAHLEAASERRSDLVADFIADPIADPLRSHPRFQAVARSMGMERWIR